MRVLLATDFSRHATQARTLVTHFADQSATTVRVVHAIEPMTPVTSFGVVPILDLDGNDRALYGEVERFADPLRDADRVVETDVLFGLAADVIIAEAARFEADLIVVGSRGRSDVASLVLGSVSAEVVDRAPCPVLVARHDALSRIVFAEDGSRSAAAGASVITDLPPLRALPVRVVSVADVPFPYVTEGPFAAVVVQDYARRLSHVRAEGRRLACVRVDSFSGAGMNATADMREGRAAAEIIAAAKADKSDLIVIGSRGLTGLTRFMLGSVSRAVLFHAPCSVLVVHVPSTAQLAARAARAEPVAAAT